MKILFTHDYKFYRDHKGFFYSDGQFSYTLWQRYLKVFDEIVVAGRVRPLLSDQGVEKLDLSSGPGVSFIEIPNISSPLDMITNRYQATKKIENALRGCDGVIARTSEISLLTYKIAERMRKPWMVEVVGSVFDALWNYGNWQGKVYAPVAEFSTRKMLLRAPYALYVTRNWLQKKYPCNGHTVGCSDVQVIKSNDQVILKRMDKILKKPVPFKIGLIGSLVNRYKGIDVALKALGKIKYRIPPFELCILGGGAQQQWEKIAAEQGLKSQTVFCGVLPSGDSVNQWLDTIDLYIQPSYQEGLPRALIEAMNRGCPALGSTAGGIPELLDSDCLHDVGDSDTLAEKMNQAINDEAWLKIKSRTNFEKAAQYDANVLDKIRQNFLLDFVEYAQRKSLRST